MLLAIYRMNTAALMMSSPKRGWRWVYGKIVGFHVGRWQAVYRATRYWLTGDTGSFMSHGGFRRSRIRK